MFICPWYHHGGMFICPQTAPLLRTFLLQHSSNCLQQEGVIKHMMTTVMITIVVINDDDISQFLRSSKDISSMRWLSDWQTYEYMKPHCTTYNPDISIWCFCFCYHPKKSHTNLISLENMQTNMKVGGLTSRFQVCIVHFLVFWGPGKFGLKRYWRWPL